MNRGHSSETPRDIRQIDEICDRFEAAWVAGEQPQIEAFLPEVEESLRPRLLRELLPAQWDLAREQGHQVDVAEYLDRFSQDGDLVRREYEKWVTELGETTGDMGDGPRTPHRGSTQRRPPEIPGYEILEVIGRGGMGVVYKARHLRLKRMVALKMVLAGGHAGPEHLARFRAEAEAVARLQHPNIVQIFDVGEHEGHPYLALELVEGGDIADLLRQEVVPVREAASIILSVARAMEYAHQCGVVHRDLKPGNLLLVAAREPSIADTTVEASVETFSRFASRTSVRGADSHTLPMPGRGADCKITDFGLAKQLDLADDGPTLTGAVLGTPQYMAPEQAANSRDVGPAADIYATGAILYALLTGRPPFVGDTPVDTLLMVQTTEPMTPTRLRPRLPRDLETICLKCLEKQPARRYSSAADLCEDLERFLDGRPTVARPVGPLERAVKWARRKPALAAAALLLLVASGLVMWKWFDAVQANRKYDLALYNSRRRESELLLREGLQQCEQGRSDRGLHHLLASLRSFPPRAPNRAMEGDREQLERMIRTNIASWSSQPVQLRRRVEHPHWVKAVAFSPDGRKFATGCHDGTLRLFETASARQLGAALELPPDVIDAKTREYGVRCIAFSPDGERVVGGTDGAAVVWNLETRAVIHTLKHPGALLLSLAYSPDGSYIVSASVEESPFVDRDAKVKLWNAESGVLIESRIDTDYRSGNQRSMHVSITPDGETLLTTTRFAQFGTAQLWKLANLTQRGPRLSFDKGVFASAINPDGRTFLTGSGDGKLQFWDLESGQLQGDLPRRSTLASSVEYTADGRIAAVRASNGSFELWNVNRRQRAAPDFDGRRSSEYSLSPDGRWALMGGRNQAAMLWRLPWNRSHPVDGRREVGKPNSFKAYRRPRCVFFQDRESVVTVRSGKPTAAVRLSKIATGETVGKPFLLQFDTARAVAVSPDGNTVATGGHQGGIVAGAVYVLNSETNQRRHGPLEHTNYVSALAFNTDASMLAAGDYHGSVRLWDPASGLQLGAPLSHLDIVLALDFHPTRNVLAVGTATDNSKAARIYLWDVDRRELIAEPAAQQESIFHLAFSPDGKTLMTVAGDTRLWNAETLEQIGRPITSTRVPSAVRFHPVEDVVAVARGDGSVGLWDFRNGDLRMTLSHRSAVTALEFTSDGKRLLAGYGDGSARLWDLATRRPLGVPFVHGHPLIGVAFSLDEQECLTVDAEDNVRRWPIPEPVSGDLDRLQLEVEVLTMQSVSEDNDVMPLTWQQWLSKKDRLRQLQPDGTLRIGRSLSASDWHDACYREAKESGNWYAACWHLDRLIDQEPDNFLHYLRRGKALSFQETFDAADADYNTASELADNAPQGDAVHDWYHQCLLESRRRKAWRVWLWYCDRVLAVEPDNVRLRTEREDVLETIESAES